MHTRDSVDKFFNEILLVNYGPDIYPKRNLKFGVVPPTVSVDYGGKCYVV